jgi:hypothetical protein
MTTHRLEFDFARESKRMQNLVMHADPAGMVFLIATGGYLNDIAARALELQDEALIGYLRAMGLVDGDGLPRYVTGPRGVLGDVGDRQRAGEEK